ncbi:NIPSNAP family protein [Tenacibaculum maritimum]|uniref:NIPSNAP family protein n=1 Tax=Tenacibaculum maritimum TaxID=107401 RepID=UPI0012E6474E|nr:NIPSNAP family protein [Tenacibaculum maritimum]MCD9583817.1 NIPSNAP family protein [Tenacibaculum maritimum]MCD9619545.1 NIPSNAP family protein [Tenacibaculum maritimum]MCD9628058.1 NIPSNAP family protein [Tenacibaculum maritimum]MCD9630901.1 NIPSNAP family protein [Tenacibaculum maritimum]MCD9633733.1 NIPSNAP family protein [Tenacibaculum maritimum]
MKTIATIVNPSNCSSKKQLYELRVYDVMNTAKQASLISYFNNALIPAYNRANINSVGVFSEVGRSEPPKIYLLIPHPSFETYSTSFTTIQNDETYTNARREFDEIPETDKVFDRYKTELILAFDSIKEMIVPKQQDRIFELRTYEGYNDNAVRRKINMFNNDELALFYEKQLHPVFFGEVIAGQNLPKITYMLTFKNMEERDTNWRNFFIENPVWDQISKASEYTNTVSRVERTFLTPLAISQV